MAAVAQTFLPIAEISAYQNKWVIKGRVTNKAPLREFKKGAAGAGKVFSVEILDAAGAEIRANFFNAAADKYFDMLEKGKCFTFSRGSVKVANKQYSTNNHRYELTFDKDAIVEAVSDDASIESIKFSFVTIKALQTRALPCSADLCAIITDFKPIVAFTSKDGKEMVKREITVADDSGTSMTIALWAERAQQEDKVFEGKPVVSLKSVSVKEFMSSRTGSLMSSGAFVLNQTSPEAKRVQEWWAKGGSSQELVDLSVVVGGTGNSQARNATPTTLAGVRLASERLSDKAELYSVVARLALVQTRKQGEPQPLHYMACQETREGGFGRPLTCKKRVDEQGFCVSCNRVGKSAPALNIRCQFVDFEDQAWMTNFHEAATKILGMTGEEVRALEMKANEKGEAGREEFEGVIRSLYFGKAINLTVRAKMDSYNGESRPNISVVDARPVSYSEHGRQMLKDIHDLLGKQAVAGA